MFTCQALTLRGSPSPISKHENLTLRYCSSPKHRPKQFAYSYLVCWEQFRSPTDWPGLTIHILSVKKYKIEPYEEWEVQIICTLRKHQAVLKEIVFNKSLIMARPNMPWLVTVLALPVPSDPQLGLDCSYYLRARPSLPPAVLLIRLLSWSAHFFVFMHLLNYSAVSSCIASNIN